METISFGVGLAATLAPELSGEPFSLVDIGCSGGIDREWRVFEPNLRAVAFDPNVAECQRLTEREKNPHVRYVTGFVSASPKGRVAQLRGTRSYWAGNPWDRLAAGRSTRVREEKNRTKSAFQLTEENLWNQVELADPSKPIILSEFLPAQGYGDVDFIKIDVDGPDYEILDSLSSFYREGRVLGIMMEVNWYGSDHPADHTFHNTDRFLRAAGFELFNLTVRRYSLAALPQRFALHFPAQSHRGRPFQGDALYLRDLGNPEASPPFPLSREKLLKLACLFDMFGLIDHAAEVLITHRNKLGCDVRPLLDSLCAASDVALDGDYDRYIAKYLADDDAFYPPR